MIIAGLIVAATLAGMLLAIQGVRALRRRRALSGALCGLSAVTAFAIAACIGLLGANLAVYHRLTFERPALEVTFVKTGQRQFVAVVTYPSGAQQRVNLSGDEWQVDARVLKWSALVNLIGFDTAYRLERISGRYREVGRERTETRTVHPLTLSPSIDVWELARRYRDWLPWVDAYYGSATYLPMADGAAFEVRVSQSGLLARPLNTAAKQAVGGWH